MNHVCSSGCGMDPLGWFRGIDTRKCSGRVGIEAHL